MRVCFLPCATYGEKRSTRLARRGQTSRTPDRRWRPPRVPAAPCAAPVTPARSGPSAARCPPPPPTPASQEPAAAASDEAACTIVRTPAVIRRRGRRMGGLPRRVVLALAGGVTMRGGRGNRRTNGYPSVAQVAAARQKAADYVRRQRAMRTAYAMRRVHFGALAAR